MALIACKNTALGYGGHAVVEGLGFQVNPGDYLCVIGENGAGKSTLMRTLLHLQPPLSGEIALGEGLRASEIGYLPQQTPVQRDFPASVREIVQSGCLNGCGLYLQSLKLAEDGRQIVIRLSEQDGRRGQLRFPWPVTRMNMLEDAEGQSDQVAFHPFEILTLGISMGQL